LTFGSVGITHQRCESRTCNGKALIAAAALLVLAGATHQASASITTLASFTGTGGIGKMPYSSSMVVDGNGDLFGTTNAGGASGGGTVFEYSPATHTISTVASFTSTTGTAPYAGLSVDSLGDLYGTTTAGGASGKGTVFEIAAGSNTITPLASFSSASPNGYNAYGGVAVDSQGNLYGTTASGGANGKGSVYEVAANTHQLTTVASLDGTTALGPQATPTIGPDGNLYLTTQYGGTTNTGALIEVNPTSGVVTSLATFNSSQAGLYSPVGSVVFDSNGNIDGTAESGGLYNAGGLFFYNASAGLTTLSFNGTNGKMPYGGLVADSLGNVYGTTFGGGSSKDGNFFTANTSSGVQNLGSFTGSAGTTPGLYPYEGALTVDSAGNVYGTTAYGGSANDGVIYEYSSITVPEPTTLSLLALPAMMLLGRRRGQTRGKH
jgi:uncharacterized repeat protein (TIGR03803 family)